MDMLHHSGFSNLTQSDVNTFPNLYGIDCLNFNSEGSSLQIPHGKKKRHMTSETIEKRKQQNRTAQKAFRERKEKHLRDVEGQLNYKQQQLQSLHDQNQYLQQKYKFLWEQYEILKKKLDQAESQLKESSNSAVLYSEIVKSLDTENFNTVEGAKFIF